MLADKLRKVLGEHPASPHETEVIPVKASVGWASYPVDGTTARELAHAAVRNLRKEKGEKDR